MRGNSTIRILVLSLGLTWLMMPSPAKAGKPRCFMHGIISPDGGGKRSISDMIRLHFDATDRAKCETMMTAYCKLNVYDKKYSPTRLKGSFKEDVDKSDEIKYRFDRSCKLSREDD